MLKKESKPLHKTIIRTGLKTFFVFEAAAFAVSFGVYYKLNTDRDFRLYMHKNHSWILDGYYTLGEQFGGLRTREFDVKIWENEGKI